MRVRRFSSWLDQGRHRLQFRLFTERVREPRDLPLQDGGPIGEALHVPPEHDPWSEGLGSRLHAAPDADPAHAWRRRCATAFAPLARALGAAGVSRTCLITSPVGREGRTAVAVGLGLALASQGRSTCLVEADLRHPALARRLPPAWIGGTLDTATATAQGGAPIHPRTRDGLARWLEGIPLPAVLERPTQCPGFSVVPAGASDEDPLALLRGPRLQVFLEALRQRHVCVLLDGPPLLRHPETQLLVERADEVVVAVLLGRTPRHAFERTVSALQRLGKPWRLVLLGAPETSMAEDSA